VSTTMRKRLQVAAAGILAAAALALSPGAAHAGPPAPQPVVQWWDVINRSYYADYNNPGGSVASCTAPGSTCTLSVTQSVSTSISTSLGYSKEGVAASLSFQLTRTVSSAASCTSPKLKSGQKYVAYRTGRQAMYQIRHSVRANGKTTVTTSSWLFSWEPYTGAHIDCYIIG